MELLDEWANFANCEDVPVFCERPPELVIKRWTSVLVVASVFVTECFKAALLKLDKWDCRDLETKGDTDYHLCFTANYLLAAVWRI